jgi:hypothetical protein
MTCVLFSTTIATCAAQTLGTGRAKEATESDVTAYGGYRSGSGCTVSIEGTALYQGEALVGLSGRF